MLRRPLGLAPFFEHDWGKASQLIILLRRSDIAGQFEPMPAGVEEINRTENAMIGRPQHIYTRRFDMDFGSKKSCLVFNVEG